MDSYPTWRLEKNMAFVFFADTRCGIEDPTPNKSYYCIILITTILVIS